MKVVWGDAALRDVGRTREYLDALSPVAARRTAEALPVAGDGSATLPRRGRPGIEPGTHELPAVWPYLPVYRTIRSEVVAVAAVFHGSRER